jgi:glutamate racemase
MKTKQPIGIFDSGVGGLSVWKAIAKLLPNENYIYVADSKNAPYGTKSKDRIIALSIKNTQFLIDQGCKMVVVACNTATTNAIGELRELFEIPFVGIEPAIKPAAIRSKTIGVLATKGTLTSDLFQDRHSKYDSKVTIVEQVGSGLVEMIENGKINTPEMTLALSTLLKPMLDKKIEALVLGCTHYNFLQDVLTKILPNHIEIWDARDAIANRTAYILDDYKMRSTNQSQGNTRILTNSNTTAIQNFVGDTMKIEILLNI